VPDDRGDAGIAQRVDEAYRIANVIDVGVRQKVIVEGDVCSGASPIAPLVRGNDIETCGGERQHLLAPAEGKLGEAVQ
jgi:hypothetical protein